MEKLLKRQLNKAPRQQLFLILALAWHTDNEELAEIILDEIKQRDFLRVR